MTGGLMQLVAYGSQDLYLTGNPQMTYFKMIYKRHTNFAMESIKQTFLGTPNYGGKITCKIDRNGDLLKNIYLEITMSDYINIEYFGFKIIDFIDINIGGTMIDKQYGEWMCIWCDLTHSYDKSSMLKKMVSGQIHHSNKSIVIIPLQFWFCKNPGLAIPLIALQFHEIKLTIALKERLNISDPDIENINIWADYVYLDQDERLRFSSNSHEYLIEQIQYSQEYTIEDGCVYKMAKFKFVHPIKELIWVIGDIGDYKECKSSNLVFYGKDRFKERNGYYFHTQQRYEYHSGVGELSNVHIYSFAINPESNEPSGTCNFSRIINPTFNLSFEDSYIVGNQDLKIYGVNYNVLRIMSGMGSLVYSM